MSKLTDRLDAHLIEDWRDAKRFVSMWIMAANGVVVAVWVAYPEIIRELLPAPYIKIFLAVLVVSSMFARLWKQRPPENCTQDSAPAVIAGQNVVNPPL